MRTAGTSVFRYLGLTIVTKFRYFIPDLVSSPKIQLRDVRFDGDFPSIGRFCTSAVRKRMTVEAERHGDAKSLASSEETVS